jgi:DNA-binding transcriptional LysR family regulator
MSHIQPDDLNSTPLPRPEDIELFVRVCDEIQADQRATLQDIADRISVKLTTLSQALKRVEERAGGGRRVKLLKRTQKIGGVSVTPDGEAYLKKFRTALAYWADLHTPVARDFVFLTVGTTSALRRYVLPGATAGFVIHLRGLDSQDEYHIRLEEGNFTDLIHGIRRGTYPYAIGWELPGIPTDHRKPGSTPYPDIEQIPLLREPVRFGAIIGRDEVRRTADDDLAEAFGIRRGDEYRRRGESPSVGLDELIHCMPGKSLVLLRSEPDPVLDVLRRAADVTRLLWVDHYEDVISFVQMGLASLGWVPQFYYRDSSLFHFRQIVGPDGKEVGRRVVAYRTKEAAEDETENQQEALPEKNREAERSNAKSRDIGEIFLKTVMSFVQESDYRGDNNLTFEQCVQGGQRINPKAVEAWAKKKLKEVLAEFVNDLSGE